MSSSEANPFKKYVDDIVNSVPSLLCLAIADVHGSNRIHACKNTEWKYWKSVSSLYVAPDQVEQSLEVGDGLPRKIKRSFLFLDDYIVLQEAIHPEVQPPPEQAGDWDTYLPTVVVTLVGKAVGGEGDMGALITTIDRIKECPVFKGVSAAVVMMESEYDYL
eukprot:TRINITY_DN14058_c0_g2_i1.p1 TRINITY_DN14058_c0_g2~~TRINITY_DN14058_c0_g2_i1.p1  ORF type:complete len:185 (+),score=44.77 TRINITY_DN14058_c0_g2_i1:72-557(+)